MPYRIDVSHSRPDALDTLIQLGALDIEPLHGGLAAIMPDGVTGEQLAAALADSSFTLSTAVARDNGSVWLLSPGTVRIGSITIAFSKVTAPSDALVLVDSDAFGTGHHPTTMLCIEAIEEIVADEQPDSVLDVGTGSGILALAALKLGVPRAIGLDIDPSALEIAAENARVNKLSDRLQLIPGGPDVLTDKWPLVVANVLPAPLIEMAPVLVPHLGKRGWLVLSGIPSSLEAEVRRAYEHFGVRFIGSTTRGGWTAIIAQALW